MIETTLQQNKNKLGYNKIRQAIIQINRKLNSINRYFGISYWSNNINHIYKLEFEKHPTFTFGIIYNFFLDAALFGEYSIFVSMPGVELIPKIRTLCISGILPMINIKNMLQLTKIYIGL